MKGSDWFVYVIRCTKDGTYYTGSTTDVHRRLAEHTEGKGAKYTRGRGPFVLVTVFNCLGSRSLAQLFEAKIKKLSHARKAQLEANHDVHSPEEIESDC